MVPSKNSRTAGTKAKADSWPVWPPAPAEIRTRPSTPASAAFLARWGGWIAQVDPYFHPACDPRHTCWLPLNPLPCTAAIHRRIYHPAGTDGRQQLQRMQVDVLVGTPGALGVGGGVGELGRVEHDQVVTLAGGAQAA